MKSFVLFSAFLFIQSVDLYDLKACETKYLGECSNVFINAWRSASKGENPREVYCRVYESLGNCLGRDSQSCKGIVIDVQRVGIGEQLILHEKTGVCPSHESLGELKKLTKANVPEWARKKADLAGLVAAKPKACDVKIANECANYIASNMIRDFKSKPCLGEEVTKKVFECFESKVKECDSKLFRDFLKFLVKYGKRLTEVEAKKHVLPNCDTSNWE
ncbi:uncharacterized protein LOC110247043 [Exaiptasia diaphana]|uniref:Uncharacterized protein n=1 Tax=Exaiptasia diaphana TaxID=2652724 RepID=A0A913XSL4_EXADI|nr:uncharacterized protein LOC110247043 [Exaiptasia diaphana]KXJ09426.1 hypothetical protein AC249_AIPGENE16795 [Exaiptasia diaphana]